VRSVLPIVVSTDHRLNDGAHLGAFTSTLATYLREPIRLLGAG
jgi:pyruvate/2-oxoglutarate dehydrogenase complex dihydrolipoamide acyltransferase (E2) component